jgi:16S rRNA (uracil1498-N3)-methyltransferase
VHRFFIPPERTGSSVLTLDDRESHHALDVLRLEVGEPVVVLNGAGAELACQVRETKRHTTTLEVLQRKQHPAPPCQVTLFQAVPKGKIMDVIIQKATELGAAQITPLLTEHCEVHLDSLQAQAKREKWQAIAVEAIKQCGSPWLPLVECPRPLAEVLSGLTAIELALLASLQPEATHPRPRFQSFTQSHQRPPRSVSVWVGPEGDFSPDELQSIAATGAQPISLGPLVLRSETAALYCLSVFRYESQWWERERLAEPS